MRRLIAILLGLAACSEEGASEPPPAGDAALVECFAGLAPRNPQGTYNLIKWESSDATIAVWLAREPGDRPFVGETIPYDLIRFGIESDSGAECIASSDDLAYEFAHHNWDDTATATGASRYDLTMVFDLTGTEPRWDDHLVIDGGAPLPLVQTDCQSLPTLDLNHCLSRSSGG